MKLADYPTSRALHDLGYDGEYSNVYIETQHDGLQIMTLSDAERYRHDIAVMCASPRIDDAAYWIEEKYSLFLIIDCYWHDLWVYYIQEDGEEPFLPCSEEDMPAIEFGVNFPTREDAIEAAVHKAIEIIKERQK